MKYIRISILVLLFICNSFHMSAQKTVTDIQGHRGCRGLMPENSIPAFIKAIQLGVTTLEMDVVISADTQVIVSHEPWINAEICLSPSKTVLELKKEDELNIYKMTYEEVKQYDCGSLYYKSFPNQEKIATYKPLLSEVFDTVISYCKKNSLPVPQFNIEIKSLPEYDNLYSPPPAKYCDLVMAVITHYELNKKCIIQSFDERSLKYMHENYPEMTLAYLSESPMTVNKIKKHLGFLPPIYSPNKILVTKKLISTCHTNHIKVIPWTVNDTQAISRLIELGVDGVITDYPDRVR